MTQTIRSYSARKPLLFGFAVLAMLVFGFGGWAATTVIAGAVVVQGQVEVEANRQVVQHPDGGLVAALPVREGDTVEKGQLLARLDGAALNSERRTVRGRLLEYRARLARLQAERDGEDHIIPPPDLRALSDEPDYDRILAGERKLFATRLDSLNGARGQTQKQIEQVQQQIHGIESQLTALHSQIELLDQRIEVQQNLLGKGLAQSDRLNELRSSRAELDGRLGELESSRSEAGERVIELQMASDRLGIDRKEEAGTALRDAEAETAELTERLTAVEDKIDRLEIRAPVGGVVYGLQISGPGAVLTPAQQLLSLVPTDWPLVLSVLIPPTSIDQVHVGQEVMVHVAAFDRNSAPELKGRVSRVSADAFQDETRGRFYRAEVRLLPGEAERLPDGLSLLPGMPVDAFIRTEDRTALTYLVRPFTVYFDRAFREG